MKAAKLLDHLMKGGQMAGQEIPVRPTHIVTRMSTDMLTVTDPDVAAALRFIRCNPNRLIQVDDVVEATNVSRRVLEKRFKAVLRRSVHQEIRRVRVNNIIPLLVGTDMSDHGHRPALRLRRRRAHLPLFPQGDRRQPPRLPPPARPAGGSLVIEVCA